MKLSQLKGTNIRKRLSFSNNKVKEEEVKIQEIDGEINFYKLDMEKLETINNEVISSLKDGDSNELLMFKIMPYVTDVECDVTYDEFSTMLKYPSEMFTAFATELVLSLNDMFSSVEELVETTNTIKEGIEEVAEEEGK